MDIVQYEELKQKIDKFEDLSRRKERIEYTMEILRDKMYTDKHMYINVCNTKGAKIFIEDNMAKKVSKFIFSTLEDELKNISSEIIGWWVFFVTAQSSLATLTFCLDLRLTFLNLPRTVCPK